MAPIQLRFLVSYKQLICTEGNDEVDDWETVIFDILDKSFVIS